MDKLVINKDEIKDYQKLKIISEMIPIKERIKQFEKSKACSFEDYEAKIKTETEDFSNWDDFIEWKAYHQKLNELNKRLVEIEHVTDIEITE